MGQAQTGGGIKPVNGIQPSPPDNWINNENSY
jgi:hypothetical protein